MDSYRHTFQAHDLPEISREEILAGIGTPLCAVFSSLGATEADITAWTATYRAFNLAHHDARVRPFPGTVDMVRRIGRAGLRLGLVTSKNRQGALRGLALVGLDDVMEVIVGADDVERPKPHPEPVERALSVLKMPAEGAVFIGDSIHDIHSGQGAGVATIGVTWGPFSSRELERANPTRCCASPADVLAVLGV